MGVLMELSFAGATAATATGASGALAFYIMTIIFSVNGERLDRSRPFTAQRR
jgi:hypothetical protein